MACMPYLSTATVQEALRRWPAIPTTSVRVLARDTTVHGENDRPVVLSAGTYVMVNSMAMQHDPKHHAEPDSFRPERHLAATAQSGQATGCPFSNDKAFSTFGAGSRGCIGQKIARAQNLPGL